MTFLLRAAIRKTPIVLLVFLNTQLMPGLAAISLTAFPLRSIADDKTLGSQSLSLFVTEPQPSSESLCAAQLGTAIDAVINRPQFRKARWGIVIEPLSKDYALYSRDAEQFFIPASNMKLLTTAAALRQLGQDFRIRTSIYVSGGDSLRVVGRGDPSLSDAQLRELAQQLKRQGIRNVQQLIIDNGYFQGNPVNLTWDWEDVQADYGASVNSLILNQNAVELTLSPQQFGQPLRVNWSDRVAARQWQIENNTVTATAATPISVAVTGVLGQPLLRIKGQLAVGAEPEVYGLAILDPAEYFLQHFLSVLAAEGISVATSVVSNAATTGERELATVESPPLTALVVETNQQSNNLYAEVLLRTLGVGASDDTAELGLKKMREILTVLGVDPKGYVVVDGSGLSRQNLVSPEAIAQTLKLMAQTKEGKAYRASLPVAGVNGTLRRRFNNTVAQGNLQAKTGTLTGVSALSGYLDVPGYQPLVFSIIVNQSDQSVETLRQGIDEIVLLLTRLRSC
jgi:D-alanyl-D-alanine carboxypeptidase/D-alanyl-D-alanine-endopeptidase (penicillin-binding protein 4)